MRKKLAGFAALALSAGLLTGCGGNDPSEAIEACEAALTASERVEAIQTEINAITTDAIDGPILEMMTAIRLGDVLWEQEMDEWVGVAADEVDALLTEGDTIGHLGLRADCRMELEALK